MEGKENHPYHQESMHKGAPPENFVKAELLRRNMTDAEKLLWERIRNNQLGVKFRRQHPIHIYIADFYCHHCKLLVELDGKYHNLEEQQKRDKERSEILQFQDLTIIRFFNQEVMQDIDGVLRKIQEQITCSQL